jgi:DNA-binding NarL/FixJ family response regulator
MARKLVLLNGHKGPEAATGGIPTRVTRVVIADGHALVRAGFRALLEGEDHISVAGEASDGERAVAVARESRPDVVLIDVSLPGLDAVETTRRVLADPGAPVMLLTTSEEDERNFPALRAGASGLLLKDAEPTELVRAVDIVARGDALLSPSLTRRVIAEFTARPEPRGPSDELLHGLTGREREVVALVAMGLSNNEIAERLVVSPATARTHVSRAMGKLHARDRAQLVVFAYETGLVSRPLDQHAAS